MEPIDNLSEEAQPPQPQADKIERIERVLEGLLGVVNQQARNNQHRRFMNRTGMGL